MSDFGKALRDADEQIADSPDVDYARTRVWQRLEERHATPRRTWLPKLVLALGAAVPVGVVVLGFLLVGDRKEAQYVATADGVSSTLPVAQSNQVAQSNHVAQSNQVAQSNHGAATGSPAGGPTAAATAVGTVAPAVPSMAPPTATATAAQPPPPADAPPDPPASDDDDHPADSQGKLVALAIGGTCAFTVDGISQGTGSSIQLTVPVGPHTVSCTSKGSTRSQRVTVRAERPGIAKFKLP